VEGAIEDIFTKNEFVKHVLATDAVVTGKNSEFMKGRDKVLPAKLFLEKCRSKEKPELSKETIATVKKLFGELKKKLSNGNV
jgi:hypothetical protein